MEKLGITLDTNKIDPQVNHVSEDSDVTVLKKNQKTFQRKSHRKWNRGKNTIKIGRKTDTAKRKANTDPFATISFEKKTHETRPY